MYRLILFALLLSVATMSCKKDPVTAQKTQSTTVYEGLYSNTTNTAEVTNQKATVTVTDNGNGTYALNFATGGVEANLNSTTKPGSSLLIFAQQPMFGQSVYGTGEFQNNGQSLSLNYTVAGLVNAPVLTFLGTKQ
jgi:hypothetical protein